MGKKIGQFSIIAIVFLALYFKLTGSEKQPEQPTPYERSPYADGYPADHVPDEETQYDEEDAKQFAQSLIQSRDYKCDKITLFSTANFSGRADVWCDDQYQYEITKPGGKWKVIAK
ncbi:TPA: hypothetical protein U2I12_000716 [Citrobacter farmeri]|uniref:hypothetical protein n=1 Tax=Citrobacter farmeri TaxID=67824 RepID=UPI000F661FC6|nr:hypothetical protein [Citrobacter farmeri]RSB18608.1 hypothetical protein EGK65_02580 [Citrobacter farmeri]HEM6628074.1 hypothetical protein [Citrobacter farmeri]